MPHLPATVARSAGCAALLVSLVGVVGACGGPSDPLRATAPRTAPPAPPPAPSTSSAPVSPLTPAQIAARATPAVVSIRSARSLGTGFVVRKDGWIATNLHVIAGAKALIVATPDRHEYPVIEVLGVDELRDLAIVRIEAKDLAALVLGDSEAVRAGDSVVAIGHPLGLEDTVSNGLVSAVRIVDPRLTVLQISAPISPGSSGGPLFSDRGEVIGVATAFISQAQSLNFGIPARYLKDLLADPHPVPLAELAAALAPREPDLPRVERNVPHHDLKLLSGCSEGDMELAVRSLDEAIAVGAPLYNQGNFSACYHVYEGAALDAERKLSAGCRGLKKALGEGRARAAGLADPSAQAWAMRDAFDGLFEVIARAVGKKKRP